MAQAAQTPVPLLFLLAAVGVHLVQPGMPHFLLLLVVGTSVMRLLFSWIGVSLLCGG